VKSLKITGYMIGYYFVLASVWASWNRWRPPVTVFYILALVQVHLGVLLARKICSTPESNRGQICAFASVSLLTVYISRLHTAGVTGSIPVAPTIELIDKSLETSGDAAFGSQSRESIATT
jgi:hypothetical protein